MHIASHSLLPPLLYCTVFQRQILFFPQVKSTFFFLNYWVIGLASCFGMCSSPSRMIYGMIFLLSPRLRASLFEGYYSASVLDMVFCVFTFPHPVIRHYPPPLHLASSHVIPNPILSHPIPSTGTVSVSCLVAPFPFRSIESQLQKHISMCRVIQSQPSKSILHVARIPSKPHISSFHLPCYLIPSYPAPSKPTTTYYFQ